MPQTSLQPLQAAFCFHKITSYTLEVHSLTESRRTCFKHVCQAGVCFAGIKLSPSRKNQYCGEHHHTEHLEAIVQPLQSNSEWQEKAYVATQFLKKMRAYDCAMTTRAPAAPRATGACSLEEPQPKLLPPMMMGYSVFISPGVTYLHMPHVLKAHAL